MLVQQPEAGEHIVDWSKAKRPWRVSFPSTPGSSCFGKRMITRGVKGPKGEKREISTYTS